MSKLNYFANRKELQKRAKQWTEYMERKYKSDIENSVQNTFIYLKEYEIHDIHERFDKTEFVFMKTDTVSAIFRVGETTDKVCALNFASYKNPGGKFIEGSSAQEEALCHESFLYNVLRKFNDYYEDNRRHKNHALYHDNLLYSKFILFFKENGIVPCHVITCAAPNKTAATKYHNIDQETVSRAMMSRLHHIFQAAYDQNVDILILGAYGTGVFGNNVSDVASMMRILLESTFKNCFKEVIFAIPQFSDSDNTFNIFKDTFYKYNLEGR